MCSSWKLMYLFLVCSQQCSINSPANGPLPPDAPSWCQAPFDPEGLLRYPCFFWFYSWNVIIIYCVNAINWKHCTDFNAVFSLLFLSCLVAFCSTVMAVVTCLVGLHYGHIIVHFKVSYCSFTYMCVFE